MMQIVHKDKGGLPIEVPRKNWEDQIEYSAEEWTVVHEGNPIVLLKRKTDEKTYQEDKFYDLELTKVLLDRHPDEYEIIDYQKAKIQPKIPINRDNLGDKYLTHFGFELPKKPKKELNHQNVSVERESRQNTEQAIDDEFAQLSKELDEIESIAMNEDLYEMDDSDGVIKKKIDVDKLLATLMALLFAIGSFIGGYYYRSSIHMSITAFQVIICLAACLLSFVLGFYFNNLLKNKKEK